MALEQNDAMDDDEERKHLLELPHSDHETQDDASICKISDVGSSKSY